jgi:hypothetical protein
MESLLLQYPPQIEHIFPIGLQQCHSRPSNRSGAEHLGGIITPGKVITPNHLSWVENWDNLLSYRIDRLSLGGFMEIALWASQCQILRCVGTTTTDWSVMLDMKAVGGEPQLGTTKLTAAFGSIDYLLLQCFRNFGSCHSKTIPTAHQDFECLDHPSA